jgi:hypothetical protein
MNQATQLAKVQEAPLSRFLYYFPQLGTVEFGGPIALASRTETDLVGERHWNRRTFARWKTFWFRRKVHSIAIDPKTHRVTLS